jgi:uncharacterized protein YndB with AHSA1/START domain
MEYSYTVRIAAPAERVWTTLTDIERMPEWTASMKDVKLLGESFAVGAKARIEQPKMRPLVWTVTELEPQRSFTWTATTAGLRLTGGHRLAAGPDNVSVTLSFAVNGLLAPLFAPLIGARIREYLQMEAEGLKRRSELSVRE